MGIEETVVKSIEKDFF